MSKLNWKHVRQGVFQTMYRGWTLTHYTNPSQYIASLGPVELQGCECESNLLSEIDRLEQYRQAANS